MKMDNGTSREGIQRIKYELITSLSEVSAISQIVSFGSVATGDFDTWSDLDLLVACESVEQTSWEAADKIRSAKKVAYYRMFTDVPQPSGRYWFWDESPFHRLDISFHSPAAHKIVCEAGVRRGHPVTVCTEYNSHSMAKRCASAQALSPQPVTITQQEADISRQLYSYLEEAKEHLRGRPGNRSIEEARSALLHPVAREPMIAGGGDLIGFISYADTFIQSALNSSLKK